MIGTELGSRSEMALGTSICLIPSVPSLQSRNEDRFVPFTGTLLIGDRVGNIHTLNLECFALMIGERRQAKAIHFMKLSGAGSQSCLETELGTSMSYSQSSTPSNQGTITGLCYLQLRC